MKEIVEKREVEELLGCEITDEQFEQALKYARHKQKYIYQREQRKVVLQHWYLVKLTEEYVRNLAFSKFTNGFMQCTERYGKRVLGQSPEHPRKQPYCITAICLKSIKLYYMEVQYGKQF